MATHLLLAEKVPDFDVVLVVSDAGVDGEMGIHKPHLVPVALGHTGDQIVDVADGSADGGHGLAGAEPCVHLQLPAFLDHLEVQVEMLEVAGEHSPWPCNPNLLRFDFDLDPLREVHRLGRQNDLHGCNATRPKPILQQSPTQTQQKLTHKKSFRGGGCILSAATQSSFLRPSMPVIARHSPSKGNQSSSDFGAKAHPENWMRDLNIG
jgi:hypothetical protein